MIGSFIVKTRMRKIVRDGFVILVITSGLLFVSEIILRVVYPEKSIGFRFDKDYLVSLKPNIEKCFIRSAENGGNIIHWKTNANSFRGNELRADPEIRIIVYGDSNIQARFSTLQNTFTHKLEKYLQADLTKDIEVVNAGVLGFGPDQSLTRFAKEADVYRPDIVIFHIYAENDFGDIIRNRLFEIDPSGNLIETGYERTVDQTLKEYSSLFIVRAARKASRLIRNKAMGLLKRENKTRADEGNPTIAVLESVLEMEYSVYKQSKPRYFSHFMDHYDLDVAAFQKAESSQTKVKLMNAVLRRANELAKSKDIQFLVLIQPSGVDLTTNYTISYKDLEKYPGYKRTNLTDAIESICVLNNIHRVNLFDVFRKANPETLYFRGKDDHWNDAGQDIAAKETASYISCKMLTEMLS